MRLLVLSPDYASHARPLIEIGRAWSHLHGDAVVATGHAVRAAVEAADLEWIELHLGKGSNPGVIEAEAQPPGEDDHLRAFFDATRVGPMATLRYQAEARGHDLLHDPGGVLERLGTIIEDVRPDRLVVDHVAFGARLALHVLGVPHASVVLGHPSALPAPGEVFGYPPEWPAGMRPDVAELAELRRCCDAASEQLTASANEMIDRYRPAAPRIHDLTRLAGSPTIYAYPQALHGRERWTPPGSVFVGSLAPAQELDGFPLPSGSGRRVTAALGSFLSARGDVLQTVVRAAHAGGWRLTIAHGSTPLEALGPLPPGAVAARHIPQVAVLGHSDAFINHGGNGSITESIAAGAPMVVLPFSTDQFAGAAAVERAGLGAVAAPNTVTVQTLVEAVERVTSAAFAARLRAAADRSGTDGGAGRAASAIAG